MPLKFSGLLTSPFLCIGTIIDLLQLSGNVPSKNIRLNSLFKSGKLARLDSLNNSAINPSGPEDLPVFKDLTAVKISSSVISELKIRFSISSSGSSIAVSS